MNRNIGKARPFDASTKAIILDDAHMVGATCQRGHILITLAAVILVLHNRDSFCTPYLQVLEVDEISRHSTGLN